MDGRDKRWRRKPKPEKLGIVHGEDPSQAPSLIQVLCNMSMWWKGRTFILNQTKVQANPSLTIKLANTNPNSHPKFQIKIPLPSGCTVAAQRQPAQNSHWSREKWVSVCGSVLWRRSERRRRQLAKAAPPQFSGARFSFLVRRCPFVRRFCIQGNGRILGCVRLLSWRGQKKILSSAALCHAALADLFCVLTAGSVLLALNICATTNHRWGVDVTRTDIWPSVSTGRTGINSRRTVRISNISSNCVNAFFTGRLPDERVAVTWVSWRCWGSGGCWAWRRPGGCGCSGDTVAWPPAPAAPLPPCPSAPPRIVETEKGEEEALMTLDKTK